jgi:hypothetical protein
LTEKNYLEKLIKDLKERNSSEHVTIKQFLQREQSRNDFRTIKQTLKPRITKGIQHLDIPVEGEKDTWKHITDQKQIEEHILKRNKKHFGQAKSTPFGNGNLQELFGYEGTYDTTTKLIEEHIIPAECELENQYIQMFVKKLSEGKIINISKEITFEEFKTAIDTWNEKNNIPKRASLRSLQAVDTIKCF